MKDETLPSRQLLSCKAMDQNKFGILLSRLSFVRKIGVFNTLTLLPTRVPSASFYYFGIQCKGYKKFITFGNLHWRSLMQPF